MRFPRAMLPALVGLLIAVPIHAATLTRLGPVLGDGRAYEVAVQGNLAAVAAHYRLLFLDIATPAAPQFLSSIPVEGLCQSVALAGDYAYVADRSNLQVYGIADPTHPTLLRTLPVFRAMRVVEDQGWLYVAAGEAGLKIYDLAAPDDPQLLGGYAEPGLEVEEFTFVGSRFYLSGSRQVFDVTQPEFVIVDLQDPAAPQLKGRWAPAVFGGAGSVTIKGSTVYLAMGSTLQMLNVSTPALPLPLGTLNVGDTITDLEASLTKLVVATNGGLRTYSIAAPAAPAPLGALTLPGEGSKITLVNATLYRAAGSAGVQIVDTTIPATPAVLATANLPSYLGKLARLGNIVYGTGEKLWVFDISTPATQLIVDQLDYNGNGVVIQGNRLYMAAGQAGVAVFDITTPSHPVSINTVAASGFARGITLQNGRLCVLLNLQGLAVYELTNPDMPALEGTVAIPSASSIAGFGTTVYVTTQAGTMSIVDLTTPGAPTIAATLNGLGALLSPSVSDGRLYLRDYPIGVRIYDLTQPTAPAAIGQISITAYNGGIGLGDHRVFVSTPTPATNHLFDATNAAAPSELASSAEESFWDYLLDATAQGDLIVAGLGSGLGIYRLEGAISATPEPGAPLAGLRLSATPAPFRASVRIEMAGLASADAEPARLTVFDAAGRLVRQWMVASSTADAAVTWDGRDAAGRSVAAGSYFLRLSAGAASATSRVIRVP